MEKYSAQLDFNSDSAVLFTDRNFLVISAHLKSSNLHIAQAQGMFEQLSNILDEHPLLKIMIGIDANHFIPDTHIPFRLVPSNQEKPTTIKKRTYLQAQFKKAGEEVRAVKDHLIAKGHIEEFQIEAIDGK